MSAAWPAATASTSSHSSRSIVSAAGCQPVDRVRAAARRVADVGADRHVPADPGTRAAGLHCRLGRRGSGVRGVTSRARGSGRRGNNEGSVYQLPDGRWRGAVLLGYRNGKPYRKYVTRKTRREVVEEIRRLLTALRSGAPVSSGSCTVAEWFATYLDQVARPKVRPRTFDRYRSDVRLHVLPTLGWVRLDKLKPAQLVGLYNAKLAAGLSPRSVRQLHAVIRRALGVAVKWLLIAVNVATLVDAPSAVQVEIQPLNFAEAQAVVQAAHHDRLEARWLVGLALGLRQGEALGLWWNDVDFDRTVLHVRRSLQRRSGGGLVFAEVKTARSQRDLPLPRQLVDALRRHRARQSEERLAAGSTWAGSECVFTTPIGTPIDPRNDFRNFKQLLVAAEVRDVRLHDLRAPPPHCSWRRACPPAS